MTGTKLNINMLPKVRGKYKIAEPLRQYTWLNVGGPAEVMFFPEDEEDLRNFLLNKPQNSEVFVIGGGSNLLVRDGGIAGFVIKLASAEFAKKTLQDNILYCGAGCLNFSLKQTVVENGLGGLEFLCSIPGTIGGALRSNAGCFGGDISKVLEYARVMNKNGEILTVKAEDFHFGYRSSDFPPDWIILGVGLRFEKTDVSEVQNKVAENDEYRRTHQPQGIRTAGSTFKNPEGNAAWKLIKQCGGDVMQFGGAKMSEKHCNFLQNDGTATAADIEKLCGEIANAVKQQTGVELELEIKKVGQE